MQLREELATVPARDSIHRYCQQFCLSVMDCIRHQELFGVNLDSTHQSYMPLCIVSVLYCRADHQETPN